MKNIHTLVKSTMPFVLIILIVCSCNNSNTVDVKEEAIKKIDYYQANQEQWLEIVKKEIEAKRKPVLFFTATWCKPCQEFKNSLNDPLMIDALKNSTLIMIDADIDAEKENISQTYDVGSYPTFIRVNEKGSVIKQTEGGAWDENIPQNMAPVLKEFMN